MASQFSTQPWLQSNTEGENWNLSGLPPELAMKQQALSRKQQLANVLIQKALQERQGGMAGKFYVAPSWTQGLAQLAEAGIGTYMNKGIGEDRDELFDNMNTERARAVESYIQKTRGIPEHTLPEGEQGPVNPAIPASPESSRSAIAQAMASRIPGLQNMAQMDYAQMNKPPERVDLGDKIGLLQGGHMVGELPKGVGPDTQANLDQKKTEFKGVSGGKQAEIDAAKARQDAELAQKEKQFYGVSGNTIATVGAEQQRHATPSGSAVLEDTTKRDLYPVASGNALAAADAQTAVAMNNHLDRVAQMEQNQRNDEKTFELKKQQGLSDAEQKKERAALDDKWHTQRLQLDKERLEIEKTAAQNKATKTEKTPLSPTAQKELFEADDAVNASRNVVTSLKKALEINDSAFEGGTASTRSKILGYVPGQFEGENATVELNNIVTGQALEQLRAVFGGMPTEGERKILLEVQGSVNMKASQRKEIYERAIQMAERRMEQSTQKAKQLREGSYFTPNGGPAAPVQPSAPATGGWSITPVP
jgi:hypothetical protein